MCEILLFFINCNYHASIHWVSGHDYLTDYVNYIYVLVIKVCVLWRCFTQPNNIYGIGHLKPTTVSKNAKDLWRDEKKGRILE